jgi:hypothetical protein
MKSALVCVFAMFLAGCGAHEDAGRGPADTAAKASPRSPAVAQTAPARGEVSDEKIGLPAYPGATEVEYSRVKLHTDIGDTFSVAYQSSDSPTQVAAFYRAEAAKVGTLKESIATSELLKSVAVDRTDGSQSAVQATSNGKGTTVISVHRFFPVK